MGVEKQDWGRALEGPPASSQRQQLWGWAARSPALCFLLLPLHLIHSMKTKIYLMQFRVLWPQPTLMISSDFSWLSL